MKPLPTDPQQMIFTGTASHKGRHVAVSPSNSRLERLNYGRVRLDAEVPRVSFQTGKCETAFICMKAVVTGDVACTVTVNGEANAIGLYDGIYIPRDSTVDVSTTGEVDLVECSAEVEGQYPLQIVRYADISKDPAMKFRAGGDSTTRDLNIVIGKNVKAGRILAGFTRSQPGNWTSWPPHEHTDLLEELYVYFDMPAPGFGIQMVYTQPGEPEFVGVVRDGDAVIMPSGYHPNVAAPGHSINFIWMMAAHREETDRLFGVVNVQPGFDKAGSGLEASRKDSATPVVPGKN
jgi:5-deoxy-glucuronate isomerase